MSLPSVARRLRSLRNWEAFNVIFLPCLFGSMIMRAQATTWVAYAYALTIVSLILAQGTFYWHLKLQVVRRRQPALPPYFCALFRRFKRINVGALLLFPAVATALLATGRATGSEIFWSTCLTLFALLEQINYYHVQLMHDSCNDWRYLLRYRKLRHAPLAGDIAAACAAQRSPAG